MLTLFIMNCFPADSRTDGGPEETGAVCLVLPAGFKMLLKLSFLPTKTEEANQKELLLSRDTLEIGAQHAVMQVCQ